MYCEMNIMKIIILNGVRTMIQKDRAILRELARQYRDVSELDCHAKTIADWKRLNSLKPVRPMVLIDQICWEEMNTGGELTLRCEDAFLRELEWHMRSELYKWNHFRVDMAIPPYLEVNKVYTSTGYGVETKFRADDLPHADALTHLYDDQIPDEAALEKLRVPDVRFDAETTAAREALVNELIGDILPVRMTGESIWAALWDRIVFWRGATPVLYDLADRPEFLHKLMRRLLDIEMELLSRYEREGLLDTQQRLIHCCGAHTDELSGEGAKHCWAAGAAQIFSEVSPTMHDEFEIEYMKEYYERFGLVNYGCCEPLHNKIDIIRKIKNVRLISVSPWANVTAAAERMGGDYVMARKPNPALIAMDSFDDSLVIAETKATLKACRDNNTPCEFILKDITTVRNEPERLTRWAELVQSVINNF